MKKFLSLALVLAMMVSSAALVACGEDGETTTEAPKKDDVTTTAPKDDGKGTTPDDGTNPGGQTTPGDDVNPDDGETTTDSGSVENPPQGGEGAEALYHAYKEIDNLDEYKSNHVNFTEEGLFDEMVAELSIFSGFNYEESEGIPEAGTNEMAPNLFDGDSYTKWCCGSNDVAWTSAIVWQMTEAVKVTGYSITTGNDSGSYTDRNPCSWRLYAATVLPEARMDDDDGNGTYFDNETVPAGWTLIDAVDATDYDGDMSSLLPDLNEYEVGFEVANPGTYTYFMLLIDYCEGGTFQMGEFTLYGEMA